MNSSDGLRWSKAKDAGRPSAYAGGSSSWCARRGTHLTGKRSELEYGKNGYGFFARCIMPSCVLVIIGCRRGSGKLPNGLPACGRKLYTCHNTRRRLARRAGLYLLLQSLPARALSLGTAVYRTVRTVVRAGGASNNGASPTRLFLRERKGLKCVLERVRAVCRWRPRMTKAQD